MKLQILSLIFILSTATSAFAACQCPTDKDKKGRKCGERSSFCRPGGKEPDCGFRDVDQKKAYFKEQCPKAFRSLKEIQDTR